MQPQRLLLGDEAIAQGALDAGVSGCYAYPGTPSTEILEHVQRAPETRERGIHHDWSCNEKTAMEEALGLSYVGKRALVCMKHVGLNVAADGFVNAAVTGVNGGVVVAVADDPSMHSSQNEQDSRFYGQFACVPVFEPGDQQEAYEMVRRAFDLSEELLLPVLVRLTTRLAHSRANVAPAPARPQNSLRFPDNPRRYILLPMNARKAYAELLDKQPGMTAAAEQSRYNSLTPGGDSSLGIIACGITRNYLMEAYGEQTCPHPVLCIRQYPAPPNLLRQLLDMCEDVLVLEEGMPVLEQQLVGPAGPSEHIRGRLSGHLPRRGELDPDSVAVALGLAPPAAQPPLPAAIPPRPPRLCDGCGHVESYQALREALETMPDARVFSDIGCYTLGALPPYEIIDTCVDMGASVSMAKGAADAGLHPSIAVLGDSTFTHSGMTPLLDCVWEQTPVTIIILDNSTTAMTGGQDSLGSGRFESIVRGIGVDPRHTRTLTPLPKEHDVNVAAIREELEFRGLSVIILARECIQSARRRQKQGQTQV
ncbi:MAG: thiamine pyrophosphate-dependent enzyme [Verrucomicrobiota bacterium]